MDCPRCASPLIVVEAAGVEVDHCTACGGAWLDSGELELLLEEAANHDALMATLKSHTGDREAKIRCPICNHKLDKVVYGEGEKVVLDMCPRNHGLWLDDGELRQVIEMGAFPENHRIYGVINDIFGGAHRK